MRRREFIAGLGSAATWGRIARWQSHAERICRLRRTRTATGRCAALRRGAPCPAPLLLRAQWAQMSPELSASLDEPRLRPRVSPAQLAIGSAPDRRKGADATAGVHSGAHHCGSMAFHGAGSAASMPVIGWLDNAPSTTNRVAAFRQGLARPDLSRVATWQWRGNFFRRRR
jgi:hypothetical protein